MMNSRAVRITRRRQHLSSFSLSLCVCVCVYISPPLFVVLGNFHFIHIFQLEKKNIKSLLLLSGLRCSDLNTAVLYLCRTRKRE